MESDGIWENSSKAFLHVWPWPVKYTHVESALIGKKQNLIFSSIFYFLPQPRAFQMGP